LNKIVYPYLLTSKNEKEKFLKALGIDCVYFLEFTEEIALMSAEEFIEKVLVGRLKAKIIVSGYDSHFGKGRSGGFEELSKLQAKLDFTAIKVEPLFIENQLVSSSLIRNLLKDGKVDCLKNYLGRNYFITGKIVHGKKIGHKLGFPTINIESEEHYILIPKNGIYFTSLIYNGLIYFGLTNIGFSPTLKDYNVIEIFMVRRLL